MTGRMLRTGDGDPAPRSTKISNTQDFYDAAGESAWGFYFWVDQQVAPFEGCPMRAEDYADDTGVSIYVAPACLEMNYPFTWGEFLDKLTAAREIAALDAKFQALQETIERAHASGGVLAVRMKDLQRAFDLPLTKSNQIRRSDLQHIKDALDYSGLGATRLSLRPGSWILLYITAAPIGRVLGPVVGQT